MSDPQQVERILNQQSDDVPIVIDENGGVHPASDGARGIAIHDAKGDYRAASAARFR